MTNLRHLVFLEKKLVSVENKDGANLSIGSIVDVAGDDHFMFLLESSGIVWMCYRPWVKFDETTHLRFVSFKTFEFEATNVFYCPLKKVLVVIGREQECDSILKFNSYDLSPFNDGYDHTPQFIQSTPLFPNLNEFRPDNVVKVAISDDCSTIGVSTEFNGIYMYRNYITPSDDQKLWVIPPNKVFKMCAKNVDILDLEGSQYLFITTDFEVVSYNLSDNKIVYMESSDLKCEASCKLKQNLVGVYVPGTIMIYHILDGMVNHIDTNANDLDSSNSGIDNIKLYCYNEYVVNCNVDNIFDNNNIILINLYSYLLDISFIAYSYYIPRLIHIVQFMNNLYLFTTNSNLNNPNGLFSSVLIFELKNKKLYNRVDILIKKRLFNWAVKLLKFENRSTNEIEQIYKIYADWLYMKNKYNESIYYYSKCNNIIEPCYVIQRFLKLNTKTYLYTYLYNYLYHMKVNKKASIDNNYYILTILLLQSLNNNNMQRLEDETKSQDNEGQELAVENELHRFLSKFSNIYKKSIKESIIQCRYINKYEFACEIAKYQGDEEEYLNILIEDLSHFDKAYELLQSASNSVKYNIIIKHSKLLLKYDSSKLLQLIDTIVNDNQKELNYLHENSTQINGSSKCQSNNAILNINNVLNTFILENDFLTKLIGLLNDNSSLLLYTIKLNILLQQYNKYKQVYNTQDKDLSNSNDSSHNNVDKSVQVEDSILKLLNSTSNYSTELIGLVLCLLYKYKRGSIIISIKMRYYNLPLILLDNEDDIISLLDYVYNYGYNEPILYINILKLLLKHNNYIVIKKLLYNVQKLLKFQNIIKIFNNYQSIQFQYLNDYIRSEFKKISDTINEYNNDIMQDKVEYMNMKKNLVDLNTNYIIINNTNCSSCGLHLEYPSIHFYCKHSYHIYCVTQDNTCPKCTYNIPDASDNDDNFFKFLIGSNDPFDYISQHFNKFLCT
ncbi:Vacuolar protein sorting-associated protein 11-like protein [Theileria parva strain Muguga]|uniref:Vacuolar protein sorting-associated protein 11-like protein n=1 Tax=Theileria parva strain Muguga TaxID=333668 RepID=UPI001C61A2E4|nr:Vacuolar protein sorting-associated protein 11-like protein [Theileria parva strain Muguga]KAF5153680.1 Vacuolar protein sorting-associated protein 11-like protein [Theileria parva strain Muguga]